MIKVRFTASLNGKDIEIEAKATDVNSFCEPIDLKMSVITDDERKIKLTSFIDNETDEYEHLELLACDYLYEKKYEADAFDEIH